VEVSEGEEEVARAVCLKVTGIAWAVAIQIGLEDQLATAVDLVVRVQEEAQQAVATSLVMKGATSVTDHISTFEYTEIQL